MPGFPLVDAHLHIWDPHHLRYPWLEAFPSLQKRFLVDDYDRAAAPYEVAQMVFVQCECDHAQYLEEVEWVSEAAKKDPRIAGIVAWAPLEKGSDALRELEFLAENKLVKGVRCPIQHAADPITFARQPGLLKGIQLLADFDFSLDLCIHHTQISATIDIVRACPGVRFILDHLGKPDIRNGLFQPWAEEIQSLAKFPNVWCKISGMVTEAHPKLWRSVDLLPYLDHVLQCFGQDRVLFGGDWPVVNLASPLANWIETLDRLLDQLDTRERHCIYRTNAQTLYRLGESMKSQTE